MQALSTRLAEIERGIMAEWQVKDQKFALDHVRSQERLQELESRLPEYHKITKDYEQFKRGYVLRERGQTIWDKAYESLTQKIASIEYDLDKDRIELTYGGFVSLRDTDPVSPNKLKLSLVALVLGLGGALGLSTVLKFLNNNAQSLNDLENKTGLKGMGIIPLTSRDTLEDIFRSPVVGSKVPNYFLENVRLIRANICLHPRRGGRSQVVMVTSSRPGEGKTTMAANLAWSFYSMGERVLLIDCDLRRGRLHTFTGISNENGLTALLTGRARELDVIKRTREDKLHVIPRGEVIAGVTELLLRESFDALIEKWRKEYDRIVLDCPPILGLSETASLQRVSDGVALVVKADQTRKKDVQDALETLRKSGAEFFGFILNAVDLSKIHNSYHYYYYSAHYYEAFQDDVDDNSLSPPGIKASLAR
jgi:capsular exopolysaccharide synthesis family protein